MVALSIVGSATLLFSCGKDAKRTVVDYETLMTESSENRTITMMENGMRSYVFTAPLVEGYSLAKNPYQEFRRGIHLTTFTSDSLSLEDATLKANYAIYYENQKLWEAKGNVVIIKKNRKDGDTVVTGLTEVYSQQLFWNATTKKIYSNVDTKVLQPDGWHFGVGFDADDDLKNIHFRKYSSEMEFDMSQPEPKTEEELKREEEEEKKREAEKQNDEKKSGKQSRNATVRPSQNRGEERPKQVSPATVSRPTRPNSADNKPSTPAKQQGSQRKQMGNASLQSGMLTPSNATLSTDLQPQSMVRGEEKPSSQTTPSKVAEMKNN